MTHDNIPTWKQVSAAEALLGHQHPAVIELREWGAHPCPDTRQARSYEMTRLYERMRAVVSLAERKAK